MSHQQLSAGAAGSYPSGSQVGVEPDSGVGADSCRPARLLESLTVQLRRSHFSFQNLPVTFRDSRRLDRADMQTKGSELAFH